jgi:hypothetical protein
MPTPSETAKTLGLEYGGFGGWIDPKTRVVKARTVNGKLVRVDGDEEESGDDDLGRLIIVNFDDELLYVDAKNSKNKDVERLIYLLKSVVRTGSDVVILHARNSEKKVAKWLKDHGITAGVTLVPYGSSSPDKKHDFVEKKVHAGYTEIQYFDHDVKAIHAIESLRAPYNKREVQIEPHQLPKLPHGKGRPSPFEKPAE